MPSDTGPAYMIVVHGRRGSKPQKWGQDGEVEHDNVSNQKIYNKIVVFGKSLDGNVLANGV